MKYLTGEQILLIHSIVIDETGGSHGVRDRDAILGLEQGPRQNVFGKELYPTVFAKAAYYTREIIMQHPFIDGNKRTGMVAAFIFLERNGYRSVAKEGAIEYFALQVIRKKLSLEEIAQWFRKNSRKTK